MCCGVDFDLRGQVGLRERFLEYYVIVGRFVIVTGGDCNEKLSVSYAPLKCGLFGMVVTSPPPWKVATAPTRSDIAAAVRNAIGPPMQ